VNPQQQIDPAQMEQARRQIHQIAEEIAQLSEAELAPADYYREFLDRLLFAAQGAAGAIWLRTPQGNLILQYQVNMREVGLERTPYSRPMHDELLRQTAMDGARVSPSRSRAAARATRRSSSPATRPTSSSCSCRSSTTRRSWA